MEDNQEDDTSMSLGMKILCVAVGLTASFYGFQAASNWGEVCHSGFPNASNHFATKSPYIPPPEDSLVEPGHLQGCQAKQVWMMVRHGTRNPSAEVITQMKTLLPKLRTEIVTQSNYICKEKVDELEAWNIYPDLEEAKEKFLVPQGKTELYGLGKRFKERYPNLFDYPYDNSTFKFKFTKTERAGASAHAFAEALFGEEGHKQVHWPEALDADPVLRFYKNCPKWKNEVNKNPKAYAEKTIFEESRHILSVIRNTETRLGLNRNLTFAEVQTMYFTCAFETAWNPDKLSPWCSVFDETDLLAMEYHQDLKHYWVDGYGHEITYKQACPPIVDFITAFQNRIENPMASPNVIAYFTHSGTQLKLLARLGLFKDKDHLKSDNFDLLRQRQWRTSKIDKFATNLAVVLHKCPTDYMITVLFQELPVKLPVCNDLACTFKEFKSKMATIVETCDVPSFCKI